MRTILAVSLFFPCLNQAQDLPARAAKVLAEHCTACHGAALKMSKLDLRTRESMLAGGERGAALTPGNSGQSRLYRAAAGLEQPSMPPGKKLPAEELSILREWIDAGANFSEAAGPAVDPEAEKKAALARLEERPITEEERRFWAFQPPKRSEPPSVQNSPWVRNPVDAFLLRTLEHRGLKPSPEADRRTLVRRVYLDVIGLPPSPAQVEDFLNDRSPDAWERLVDQLLNSPHYGERWARHWLDLVRYADSAGYEFDRDRPNAWRYRDYVVRSFNDDKPYSRFIREQLAGDEFWPESTDARTAIGYLRLGPEANITTEQTRMDELDDILATTAGTFFGMTLGCARCHNHKFDPIPQKDYYRMQAVFFPAKGQDVPLVDESKLAEIKAGQRRIDDLQAPLKKQKEQLEQPYRDKLLKEKKDRLPDYVKLALATPPEKRTEGQKLNATQVEKTLRVTDEELEQALNAADLIRQRELKEKIDLLERQRPRVPSALGVAEKGPEPPPSHFLHHGSVSQKGSVMTPGVLSVAARGEVAFPAPPKNARSSYRRRAFADWVASPENPLTARVMVNRIWQHHFGEGIVRTPSNFGKTGEPPTHPELLDWLATEFVREEWSIKRMHRLMLTSSAYRMAGDDIEANRKIDPENRYLWRMPRRRLEGEILRDSILAVAGTLDRKTGGPGVYPYIDPSLWASSSRRFWPGRPDHDPSTWRRSLYVFSKRTIPLPMLEVFDKPDSNAACPRRNRSTVATQSLILMNNSFVLRQVKHFAQRVQQEAGADPSAQVGRAFQIALARAPSETEREAAVRFVRQSPYGLVDFCQALVNLNEFAYIP